MNLEIYIAIFVTANWGLTWWLLGKLSDIKDDIEKGRDR